MLYPDNLSFFLYFHILKDNTVWKLAEEKREYAYYDYNYNFGIEEFAKG
jgi:hypothetical protein